MDKKRLIAILQTLTQWVLFVVKYVVYFTKFIFWETRKLVQKYPKYAAAAGVLIVLLIVGRLFSSQIIKFINAPRPLPLSTASKDSGYQFAATNNRTKFSALIGEAKTNSPKVSATFVDGATMSFVMTNLNQNISKPSKSGNKVLFKNVRNAIDVEYQTLTTGIKENIILKEPQEGNAISFTLDTFGATPKKIAPKTYGTAFYDNKGRYIFHFAKPYAVDAKGVRTDNVLLAIQKNDSDTNYTATIIINDKWLADPARVYPITVDPTVDYSVYSDVSAGTFNRVTDTGSNASISSATGGTISTTGDYTVHTFTASGTFTPAAAGNIEILVVGGGGGGAGGATGGGGGGGGGGVIYKTAYPVTAQAYSVTVGNGGGVGTNGNDSVFDQLTAKGGGKGGAYQTSGSAGGSGGGSGRDTTTATGGSGTSEQGNSGGKATLGSWGSGGGGGGAGGAGYNGGNDQVAQTGTLSNGGIGVSYSISGSPVYYGGGGGGAWVTGAVRAAGGLGGGGAGGGDGVGAAVAGSANTGGGGGGDRLSGAAGGSGVVIIRYKPVNTNLTTYYQELSADKFTAGLWHMNESSGTTTVSDASGNANTGTSTSSTNVVTGLLGNARSFNGSSQNISLGNPASLQITGPLTIEAWINTSAAGAYGGIVGKMGNGAVAAYGYVLRETGVAPAGRAELGVSPDGSNYYNVYSTSLINDGKWHHVAGVYGPSLIQIYVDGQLQGTTTTSIPAALFNTGSAAVIGSTYTNLSETFNGSIDEVRISNVARSAEEIRLDAQRRPYGVYTSEVVPLNTVISNWNSMRWTELGVGTGDGETLLSTTTTIPVSDSFNRANSTTSLGTADSGQTYTLTAGTFGISGNAAYLPSGCGPTQCYALIDTGSINGTMQITLPTNHQDVRLPFRFVDMNNFYWVENNGGGYNLNKYVAGVRSQIASWGGTAANGDTIKIVYVGSGINVYLNGTLIMTKVDTSVSGTKAGFGTYSNTAETFDNFTVSVDTTATPPVAQWNFNETSGTTAVNSSASTAIPPASGGTETDVGGYHIHTFTTSGTFNVTGALSSVDVLVVGGGGGGGWAGGGGGAGGYIYQTNYAVSTQSYSVTVGTAGNGGTSGAKQGVNGGNSVFSTLTAVGGGGGGAFSSSAGTAGGSGGGGASSGSFGAGTGGQGNSGGSGGGYAATNYPTGGGGGAGGVGQTPANSSAAAGNGGPGLSNSISGSSVFYAGGGGGGAYTGVAGTGGSGVGGNGANNVGVGGNGTSNTGGGGGGGSSYSTGTNGGNGGSGIVIIRYPYFINPPATGGTESNSGGYHIHTFTAGGTFTVTGPLTQVRVLVVGGGGGGSKGQSGVTYGGGGGGGGVQYDATHAVSTQAYTVTVGGGGAGATGGSQNGTNGNPSVFDTITSGGGVGGGYNGNGSASGTPQSNSGGARSGITGGGGGGSGGATTTTTGGSGTASTISGASVTYGGGGGGSNDSVNGTGVDGGGNGGALNTAATSGAANRGGGGGSTRQENPSNAGSGGSGVVIISYPYNAPTGACGSSCDATLNNFASTGSQDAAPSTGWTAANKRWGAGSLMFDGVDDFVSCTDANCGGIGKLDPGTGPWSLSAWVKTSSATRQQIISKGASTGQIAYELWLTPTGTVSYDLVNTADAAYIQATSTTSVNDGAWHYIVGTYDGTTLSVFIDGKLAASSTTKSGTQVTDSNSDFQVGFRTGVASSYFKGVMDVPSVYSRALTASEILSNYNAGNVEVQTRVGNSTNPNDGSWEDWRPATSESPVDNLNSSTTLPSGCSATGGTTPDGGNTFIFTTGKTFFGYTGADQIYTVPAGVTSLTIKMWGGGGGGGAVGGWTYGFNGGGGGYTTGTLAVTPGQVLQVVVGAGGTAGTNANRDWNYGGGGRSCNTGSDCRYGGQGGGYSAVAYNNTPLLMAGGGGGGGSSRAANGEQGGAGGGTSGVAGSSYTPTNGGGGGTQSAGGAGGTGSGPGTAGGAFYGGTPGSNAYGGSGGGGYFGGGGGAYTEANDMGGGGGGSGYIGGAGVTSATTTAGSGITQANSGDADNGGMGAGGSGGAAPNNGVPGKVVITPVQAAQSLTCTTGGNVEVLVVAGGGGGGTNMGGGGGGGGVLYNPTYAVTANTPVSISVGAGGMGAPAGYYSGHPLYAGTNGENSVFGTMTAIGGGRGGSSYNNMGLGIQTGAAGGSGGGATGYNNDGQAAGAVTGGAGTPGQGFRGGNEGNAYYAGGGGGAGGAGADGNNPPNGGPGIYNDILGTGYYWGGGGGGAGISICGGNGGVGGGGGGAQCTTSGGDGLNPGAAGGGGATGAQINTGGGDGGASTGGGGGAGAHYNYNNKGGNGGSGIVVVRVSRLTTDTTTYMEGTGSQKLTRGILQADANTIGLWHLDETGGSGAYLQNSSTYRQSVYTCTGGNQTYTVPAGVTSVHAKMWGAGGGAGYLGGWSYGFPGGGGGFTAGDIAVTPGQQLVIVAGCGGINGSVANTANSYGGGGLSCGGTDCRYGGQGGGYSSIWNNTGTVMYLAAGGGGGGGASRSTWPLNAGGAGGGTTGQDGSSYTQACAGHGGTQSAGGAGGGPCSLAGTAGALFSGGHPGSPYSYGGGGGGGYYGGGGGAYMESNDMGGAGGGSGYIVGPGVTNAITLQGRWRAQAAANDPDNAGAGLGGQNQAGVVLNGQTGRVVITANASAGGTPTGTTVANGISGKAQNFDGTDYISFPTLNFTSNPFTIEFWVNPRDESNQPVVISNGVFNADGFYMHILTTGGLAFYTNQSGANQLTQAAAGSIPVNKWSHIGIVRNGASVRTIVNGVDVTSSAGTHVDPAATSRDFIIGGYAGNGSACTAYCLNGLMDELKVSNVARSQEEIAEDYRAGRDYRITRTLPASTDLSAAKKLAFTIAADRPGTYLEATIGNSAFANYVPDANTVALWHLDEANGSSTCCKDSSAYRNNITGTAGTLPTFQGKIGLARALDGSASQMTATNNSSLDFGSGNFTVDYWEYRTDAQSTKTAMQRDYSADGIGYTPWMAGYSNGPGTTLGFFATSCGSACAWDIANNKSMGAVILNQWVYYAITRNGSTFTTYQNGVPISTWTSAGTIQGATGNGNFVIGQYWTSCTSGNYCFKGMLDEIRLSKAAYSAADIRAAYEYGLRSHEITIDFAAKLASSGVTNATTSFNIDATAFGLSQLGSNLSTGDNLILRENYNGTTYIAQATVSAVLASSGAVTIPSWKSGSTFPASGFSTNADVFKWQQEYFDLGSNVATNRNAITRLTLRETNGQEGRTIWLDDLRSVGNYLSNPAGSPIMSSTADLYAQYRLIFSTSDYNVSSAVTSATLDFTTNAPNPPTIGTPSQVTTSSVQWNFTGTGGGTDTAGFALFDNVNATVSANVTCAPGACIENNLMPNTAYTRKIIAFNSASQKSLFSHAATAFTLAEVPPSATPSAVNSTTLSIVSLSAGFRNPPATQMAIYLQTGSACTGSGGYYLAADGSNNSSAAVWQTASAWNSSLQPITGLNFETTSYVVCVKARNGASVPVETDWSSNAANAGFLPISGTYTMVGNTTFAAGSKFTDGRSPSRYVEGLDSGPADWLTFDESSLTSNGETPYGNAGLLGQWHMNEVPTGTTIVDSSGNSNTGTSVSSTNIDVGKFGNARTFNGTTDSVSIANPNNFNFERTNPFTIEGWIKTTTSGGADIVNKMISAAPNNGYELFLGSGHFGFYLINTWPTNVLYVTEPTNVNDGAWHHYAVTYAGTSTPAGIHMYIDGVDQTLTTVYNTLSGSIVNSNNITLGSRNGSAGNGWFNGSLDEVRIYNRVLPAQEIYANAKGYFADSSDLSNHGVPYGPTITSGKNGNAANFDGTSVIKIGNVVNMGTSDLTIDAWIKTTSTDALVIAKDWSTPGYYCGVSQSKFYCGIDSGASHPFTRGRTVINNGAWHHLAGVFERSGKITIYTDGVQDNPSGELADISALSSTDVSSTDYLCLGGNCSAGGTSTGNYFNGQLDDVHIYNVALSKFQIQQDMNNVNQPQNVSKMVLSKGVLTVLPNETVAVGSITFPSGSQASIALPSDKSAQIKPGSPIWVVDADKDGYFPSANEYFGARPTGGRRRLTMSTLGSNHLDCNDNSSIVTINTITVYPDTDGDGYGYGSGSQVLGCTQAPNGYSLTNDDCGPSDANAHPNSSYCSTSTFTNTSSAQSYDWNCSASGGAGSACGTTYYSSGTVACNYAAVCGIYGNQCCSQSNCTFNTTGVACGAAGTANGTSALVYPDCVNPVTYYNPGTSGTQACQ